MLIIGVAVGALIGLSLGALGGGGSILTVPALVYLLGQSPRSATTGSLLIVGITALAGTVSHYLAGRVRLGPGVTFGLLGVAGSYVGTRLSSGVSPSVLLTAFAGLMVVAAVAMHRRRGTAAVPVVPDGEADLAGGVTATLRATRTGSLLRIVAAASGVGLLTGFFGVGGGFVIVPALVLALGFTMPVAVGTSLLVIAINSAAALAVRLGGHTHLDWSLLAVFTVAAIAGSVLGNRVASRVNPAVLSRAFTALLVVIALYTAIRSVPHLL